MNADDHLNHSLILDMPESAAEAMTVVGRTIVDVRLATDEETLLEGLPLDEPRPVMLVLDDGTKIFPGRTKQGDLRLNVLFPEEVRGITVWSKGEVICPTNEA